MKIGQRDIKTIIAILICAMTYLMIRIVDRDIASKWYTPFFAGLAAAYSMQLDKQTSVLFGKNRILGSLFGGLMAICVVLLYRVIIKQIFPNITQADNLYLFFKYIIISVSVLFLIRLIELVNKTTVTFIAILTFLSVSIGAREDIPVWVFGLNRIISTSYGVFVAWCVNLIFLVFHKDRKSIYVIEVDDFVVNNRIYGFSLYKFRKMIEIRINLVFFSVQTPGIFHEKIKNLKLESPVILLNGACIFDYRSKEFLYEEKLGLDNYYALKNTLSSFGIDPFVYEINNGLFYISKQKLDNDVENDYFSLVKDTTYSNFYLGINTIINPIVVLVFVENIKLEALLDNLKLINEICFYLDENKNGYTKVFIYNKKVEEMNCIKHLKNHYCLDKVVSLVNKHDKLIDVSDTHFKNTNNINKSLSQIERKYHKRG